MTDLTLALLGPSRITYGQRPLTKFRTKAVPALLVYLACQPEAHRRDRLMTLFWPDILQTSAQQSLRQTLYLLKQTIPEIPAKDGPGTVPLLLTNRQTVQINPDGRIQLDLHTFNRLLDQDESHWPEAVALYRDDFLADFYLPDCAPFEEWAAARRADCRRQILDTLDILAERAILAKDFEAGDFYARRQLEIDNLRESAHRQLMRILMGNGRRRAALTQYETLSRLLQTELAVAPSAETQELYEAVRADAFNNVVVAPASPRPGARPAAGNLPAPPTPFIGREAELAELARLLAEAETRLITILGAGGMGKTRLALAAAEANRERYDDGVYFISLAPLEDAKTIVPAIAGALNFSFYQGGAPQEQLLNYLRQKQMLLVLDNFEHLLNGAGIVADILQNAPGVKLLATSRARLGVQGEQLFRIAGMGFPAGAAGAGGEEPEDAREYSAVRLFAQTARRIRPDFAPDAADLQAITRICRLTEGMPLGILLAAAWMEMLSPQEIAGEIDRSLNFLETDAPDVPGRHRSMGALFDSTWNFLSGREQQLFAALSVFRGGFTRLAAQEVTGASLRELMTLVNKSLVQRGGDGRFATHELLRQFAARKLSLSPDEQEAAGRRHAAYYCQMLRSQEPNLKGGRIETALAEIAVDIDNIQTTWNWAVEREQYRLIRQAVFSMAAFYLRRNRYQEGLTAFDLAEKRLSRRMAAAPQVNGDELLLKVRLLAWQGALLFELGSTKAAEERGQAALTILESAPLSGKDTRYERALVLLQLGRVYEWLDRHAETAACLEESQALFAGLNERWGLADAIHLMGGVALRSGQYELAIERATEAQRLYEALGDRRSVAYMQFWIGACQSWLGQLPAGERLIKQSLALFQEIGDQKAEGWALDGLGQAAMMRGDFEEARAILSESIALHTSLGMKDRLADSIFYWCWATMLQGEYDRAQTRLGASLNIFQASENPWGIASCIFVDSSIRMLQSNGDAALKRLRESAEILRNAGQRDDLGQVLAVLSCAFTRNGDLVQAGQCLNEAQQLAQETRSLMSTLYVLAATALFLAANERAVQAVELYTCVNRHPLAANSRWFDDVAGKPVRETAVTLPPNVVAAAQAQGREMDLWEAAKTLL